MELAVLLNKDASTVLYIIMTVFTAIRLAALAPTGETRALVVVVSCMLVVGLWVKGAQASARDRRSAEAEDPVPPQQPPADRGAISRPGTSKAVDLDLWTMRNPAAPLRSAQLRHLALRPHVMRSIASLRTMHNEHGGTIRRFITCLEDFYARYDSMMAAQDPAGAQSTMPVLMDTRAEALNLLNALTSFGFVTPGSQRRVRQVSRQVRRDTYRCVAQLGQKYADRPGLLVGRPWRPPYAYDARKDPAVLNASYNLNC
jgi:hypothetical protein